MSKRLHLFIVLSLLLIIILVGANFFSFSSTTVFIPVMFKNYGGSPSPPSPTGYVEIKDIFNVGTGQGQPDEYVLIENEESFPIQLQNWTLKDAKDHTFTFPSFVIQPNQQCRIYTNQIHPQWCSFSYGSGTPIWNNDHDTAYLRDASGTLIDDYSY